MTSKWLNWCKRLGYPFSTIARRIKKKMRESFSYLFVLAIASIFTISGVVIQPLISTLDWSSFTLFNLEVVLSRFLYALPLIAFFVIMALLIIVQIKKIDKEKDQKQMQAFNKMLKDALNEDREVKEDIGDINREIKLHFERNKEGSEDDKET